MHDSMRPIATLHVDIEGGWGGSSRSLFELLSRVDRHRVSPVVVHRQSGPLTRWYADIGVPTYHVPEIGSFVPRGHNAMRNFVASLPRLARLDSAARRIAMIAEANRTQLIHLNYEGLFLLARRLRRLGIPMIAHSRAMVGANRWGRWLARSLAESVSHIFFISPQEEARFRQLLPGTNPPGGILWNISRPALPRRPFADPPEVVSFGSIDWVKGTDRLVHVARALRRGNAPALRIAIYGKARTDRQFATEIEARIAAERLSDRIVLRGYTEDPMSAMAGALALIRPSRDNDPWGRDVIEAAAAGLPVLATGTFDGVIRDGETGFLMREFDAEVVARRLAELLAGRDAWQRMSEAAARRAEQCFSGRQQVEQFMSIVMRTIKSATTPGPR